MELDQLSKGMLKVLSEVILDIDSLQVYFLNSKEMSRYLHSRGVNIRYIGSYTSTLTTPSSGASS